MSLPVRTVDHISIPIDAAIRRALEVIQLGGLGKADPYRPPSPTS